MSNRPPERVGGIAMKISIRSNIAKSVMATALALVVLGTAYALATMDGVNASSATESPYASGQIRANYSRSDVSAPIGSLANPAVGFTNGTVTVTRSASVSIEPDHAVLNLGVEAVAVTVASARQTAAERMTAVLDAVKEAGVVEDDIATTMFEIAPETQWEEVEVRLEDETIRRNQSRIVGYSVRNGIEVTVRDIDTVGDVIDAAAVAGGDAFRVPQMTFAASDRGSAADQARQLAAADARRVAQLYADSLGFILGPVVEMVEYGSGPAIRASVELATDSGYGARTPIIPGDLDVSATVEVSFAILGATRPASE